MLDFSPVRERRQTIQQLADPLSIDDLRDLTNESIDMMLTSIEGCTDAETHQHFSIHDDSLPRCAHGPHLMGPVLISH